MNSSNDLTIVEISGDNPRCQYCGSEIAEVPVYCRRCMTPHHAECFTENGKCTTYGCGELRCFLPTQPTGQRQPKLYTEEVLNWGETPFGTVEGETLRFSRPMSVNTKKRLIRILGLFIFWGVLAFGAIFEFEALLLFLLFFLIADSYLFKVVNLLWTLASQREVVIDRRLGDVQEASTSPLDSGKRSLIDYQAVTIHSFRDGEDEGEDCEKTYAVRLMGTSHQPFEIMSVNDLSLARSVATQTATFLSFPLLDHTSNQLCLVTSEELKRKKQELSVLGKVPKLLPSPPSSLRCTHVIEENVHRLTVRNLHKEWRRTLMSLIVGVAFLLQFLLLLIVVYNCEFRYSIAFGFCMLLLSYALVAITAGATTKTIIEVSPTMIFLDEQSLSPKRGYIQKDHIEELKVSNNCLVISTKYGTHELCSGLPDRDLEWIRQVIAFLLSKKTK